MQAYLPPHEVAGQELEPLVAELLLQAAQRAVAPISNFHVGAVGLGASGALYLGYNLEFPGQFLHHTVHAEQFVAAMAAAHHETALERLFITATPCGHCRQFLCDLAGAQRLRIQVKGLPETTLAELLPHNFGPADLGIREPLLAHPQHALDLAGIYAEDGLHGAALEAARRSYAPYSDCPAGLAFRAGGRIYAGALLENAAYNPSLAPLQAALIDYYAQQAGPPEIEAVVLHEWGTAVSQAHATRSLLATLAPRVELHWAQHRVGSFFPDA